MKTFKPIPFTIEISERPRYIPGSGPPMMPISLRPPDDGKGWLIHSVVNWEGIPQYLVTPPDNPAHRVPVRKELILNWVSPRTYEDFEYLQAKKREEEEWDEDNSFLARALRIKEERFRMFQAKNTARSKLKLETGITSKVQTGSSSCSTDSDNESVEVPAMFPRNVIKQSPSKRVGMPDSHEDTKISSILSVKRGSSRKRRDRSKLEAGRGLTPKRQKLSSSSQNASLGQPSLSRPIIKQELETSGGEDDQDRRPEGKDDGEEEHDRVETSAEISSRSSRPILPPPRAKFCSRHSPLLTSSRVRTDDRSRKSSSGDSIRISRILPPPRPINLKVQRSSPKDTQSSGILAVNPNPIDFKEYPPILPPQKFSLSQHTGSLDVARRNAHASNRTTPWAANGRLKSQTSVSTGSEPAKSATPNGINTSPRNGSGGKSDKLSSLPGNIMKGLDKSKIVQNRNNAGLSRSDEKRSLSNSVKRLSSISIPSSARNSRSRDLRRVEPAIIATPKKGKLVDEAEEFEIIGLIDDELRKVNGVTVRYYLVDWKGDFDPTWEAEYNVSEAAIKAYKKKLLRRQAFDGALDDADDIPAPRSKSRNQSVSHIDIKVETDSNAVFDISSEFPTNSYYKEPDDSDLQAAILLENGYEDEMEPLVSVQDSRQPSGRLCSI
jgi:hypothetical protein